MKTLLFDIETAPTQAYVWGRWKQNIHQIMVEEEGYVLCWAAKWMGDSDDKIMLDAVWRHEAAYKKDSEDDIFALDGLWKLLNEADVVVGHNAKGFDVKTVNARFIKHGFQPPTPYKVVDTLLLTRSQFKFPSNKLDDLGKYLDLGSKVKHEGFDLWRKCMQGDKAAQKRMEDYNIGDITLLEALYVKLRGWSTNHPNHGLYIDGDVTICRNCGGSHIIKYGTYYTAAQKYQRYRCTECGATQRGRNTLISKEKRQSILV